MSRKSLLLGAMAGALGGAIGTLVLNVFQKASVETTRALEANPGDPG